MKRPLDQEVTVGNLFRPPPRTHMIFSVNIMHWCSNPYEARYISTILGNRVACSIQYLLRFVALHICVTYNTLRAVRHRLIAPLIIG